MHRRQRATPTRPAWARPVRLAPRRPRCADWSSIREDRREFRLADGSSSTSAPGTRVRQQLRPARRRGGESGSKPSSVRRDTHQYVAGLTGTGKSWISCALAHKACLEGFQALYLRVPRLLNDLRVAHGEGTIARFYRDLARIDFLVLDDWGLAPIEPARGRATSSKSSTTAPAAARSSSPPSCRYPTGIAKSRIRPSPTPSSIVWFMAPPASSCTAPPCASTTPAPEPNHEREQGAPRCARRCRRSAPGHRNNRRCSATAWRARDAPAREGSRVARTPCSTVLAQKPSAVVPMTEKSRRGEPPTTA